MLHKEVVQPCLEVLRDPRFATANNELMEAFDKVRQAKYADAITSCGSAFESVLKSICEAKNWTYYADGDTCGKLLDACQREGLFPGFYRPALDGVGRVRNKISDAHGRAHTPHPPASRDEAEHMIHMACADIVLLVGLARL
jgi:hypothetical protein